MLRKHGEQEIRKAPVYMYMVCAFGTKPLRIEPPPQDDIDASYQV